MKIAGWSGAQRRSLAGDASFRRYDRLTLGSRKAVLMEQANLATAENFDVSLIKVLKELQQLSHVGTCGRDDLTIMHA